MPTTEMTARKIASEWHGGQSSALYSFASTGTSTGTIDRDEIDRELWLAYHEAKDTGCLEPKDDHALTLLREYIEFA